MRLLILFGLLVFHEAAAHAEKVWLVVGASSATPDGIAHTAKPLAARWPGGLIFRTADCGEKREVFGWAYRVAGSADDAKGVLAAAREIAKAAYVKLCEVAPRSLLALRVPAVDASIADLPASVAGEWEDEDRVSRAVPLANGRTLVIKRVFKAAYLEDPAQGKDQGVWLAEGGGKLTPLAESCSPAEAFTVRDGKLAFQCGDSIAADELLHKVLVFDGDKQVAAVSSCQKPRWTGPTSLVCSSESVDHDGNIELRSKKDCGGQIEMRHPMRRTAIVVSIPLLAGVLGLARAALGGDDGSDNHEEEAARAARAARSWRRDGVSAAPKVVAALRSGDVWLEDEARKTLLQWGPPAVPPLLDRLARDLGQGGRSSAEGNVKETLSQLLCSAGRPATDDRDGSSEKVGVADGPRASAHAKAILKAALAPILTALKRKEGPRARAASLAVIDMSLEERCANRQAVFRMTGEAVVALVDVQTAEQKGDFLLGLSALGPAARSAVPIALPLLDDPRFKAQAIQLLGAIGPASAPAVPKLRSLLAGDQRVAAALALGEIGPPARAALPDLISVLAESDRQGCQKTGPLRALALPVGLLGATGEGEASQAVGALLSSLRACPQNAEAIITALGSVGPRGRPAEPALLAVMRDGTSRLDIRLLASQSLGEIGAPLSADDQALVRGLEAELRRRKTPRPFVFGKQL